MALRRVEQSERFLGLRVLRVPGVGGETDPAAHIAFTLVRDSGSTWFRPSSGRAAGASTANRQLFQSDAAITGEALDAS